MIAFRRTQDDPNPYYKVKCKAKIGTFEAGEVVRIQVMVMCGRIYKPGKNKEGKYIDTEGKADDRVMAFGTDPKDSKASKYACATKEVINEHFEEIA